MTYLILQLISNEIISFSDSKFPSLRLLFSDYTNMSFMFEGCENLTSLKINEDAYNFLKEKEKLNKIFPNNVNLEYK